MFYEVKVSGYRSDADVNMGTGMPCKLDDIIFARK